jgi:flagellar assembly protein FliH
MSEKVTRPTRWDVPSIDGSEGSGFPTAGRLEALQKDAYDEAWQKGHADGLAAGEKDARERIGRLNELLKALAHPFDELDEMIEKQLVELAMAVVKQLFRREIRTDPTHVIGVVREAIQLLPAASRSVQLHLHPEDASLVRESLSPTEGELAWTIVEDPLIARGGCNVTTENSRIDATNESRLRSVIAAIAGDERS